ncbi:TSUP family transporter, partial [Prevotella sp.]
MSIIVFTILLLLGAYCAGLLGSLTGLGGGVIVIPLLTLVFGIDFHYAIGAALVASIATSSGSASAYVKEGMTNIRLGMFLEIATSIGAVIGAAVALWMPTNGIAIVFGAVLLLTIALQFRQKADYVNVKGSRLAMKLKLFG